MLFGHELLNQPSHPITTRRAIYRALLPPLFVPPPSFVWQLPETARHAYVLRPLPARARRLNAWHAELRRTFLGIVPMSPARKQ